MKKQFLVSIIIKNTFNLVYILFFFKMYFMSLEITGLSSPAVPIPIYNAVYFFDEF